MRHRAGRIGISILLALYFAVGFLPRAVLCVGSNGHYEIELLNAACCDRASTSSGAVGVRHRECSRDCIDTPISSGPALTTADSAHHDTPAPCLLSVPVVADSTLRSPERSILLTRFATSAHLRRVLRTTVILC